MSTRFGCQSDCWGALAVLPVHPESAALAVHNREPGCVQPCYAMQPCFACPARGQQRRTAVPQANPAQWTAEETGVQPCAGAV